MPGDSPGEAVKNFLTPIKDAIAVLGNTVLLHSAHPQVGDRQAVVIPDDRRLRVSSTVYGSLRVSIGFTYEVVVCDPQDPRGPYRCTTRSYIHSLYDMDDKLLIAFHWHPAGASPERKPHMHIGSTRIPQANELHVPTPRITVEEVVTLAIESFGAEPTVGQELWRPMLEESQATHEFWRDWHHRTDAPTKFS